MRSWLFRRSLQALITFAVALALLFLLMRAAPGDPLFRLSADRPISPQAIEAAPRALRTRSAGGHADAGIRRRIVPGRPGCFDRAWPPSHVVAGRAAAGNSSSRRERAPAQLYRGSLAGRQAGRAAWSEGGSVADHSLAHWLRHAVVLVGAGARMAGWRRVAPAACRGNAGPTAGAGYRVGSSELETF